MDMLLDIRSWTKQVASLFWWQALSSVYTWGCHAVVLETENKEISSSTTKHYQYCNIRGEGYNRILSIYNIEFACLEQVNQISNLCSKPPYAEGGKIM